MRLGAMPYSFVLAMILSNTFRRSAAFLGIPVSSLRRAMTCQPGFSAMMGKIASILCPSPETELNRPGLLQNLYASLKTFVLGLSTEMGRSVTDWMQSIIQRSVSTSCASGTDAQQSINVAPASVCAMARCLIKSASRRAMASATDGMEPLIFSPMIIINFLLSQPFCAGK